jgi:hypothetical protein
MSEFVSSEQLPNSPDHQTFKMWEVREQFDKIIPFVLGDVNAIRISLLIGEGKLEQLPPGVMRDSHQCVLARALSNGWTANVGEEVVLRHPWSPDASQPDFVACCKALQDRGFDAEVTYDEVETYNESTEEYEYTHGEITGIELKSTRAMCQLITWFDGGFLPELILGYDD